MFPQWGDVSIRGLFFSAGKHYKNPAKRLGLVQSESRHHFNGNLLVLAMI